jgi:hypothetical protein
VFLLLPPCLSASSSAGVLGEIKLGDSINCHLPPALPVCHPAGAGGNNLLGDRKQFKDQELVRGNAALVGNMQVRATLHQDDRHYTAHACSRIGAGDVRREGVRNRGNGQGGIG